MITGPSGWLDFPTTARSFKALYEVTGRLTEHVKHVVDVSCPETESLMMLHLFCSQNYLERVNFRSA